MPTIVIRADAQPRIGVGHAMRCLALAQAWRDRGGTVTVLSAVLPDFVRRRFLDERIEVVTLPALGEAEDAERTAAIGGHADWVVLDGYHFGALHQQLAKDAGTKVLAIDDYAHAGAYVADLILNQNLHAAADLYAGVEPSRVLCGPRFVLLRREFRAQAPFLRDVPALASRLLVTLGGSDVGPIARAVNAALHDHGVRTPAVTVVSGSAEHGFESRGGPVRVVPPQDDMAAVMRDTDLAVASAGSTAWELAFMQVPSVLLSLADNQTPIAAHLDREGVARSLGRAQHVTAAALARAVNELAADRETRAGMASAGRMLIDGAGIDRVLMRMLDSPVRLRPARAVDSRRIWEWANEPATRAASFATGEIPWPEHERWFAAKLADARVLFFVAVDADDRPVGQVRIERAAQEDAGVISIAVGREHQRRGLGARIIAEACQAQGWPMVIAHVKPENGPSVRVFERAGFAPAGQTRVRDQQALRFEWRRRS